MKSIFGFSILVLLVSLFLAPVQKAEAFELGGLKFSLADSPTVMSDVQIVGRSGGRSFVGGGVCSGYAWRLNVADTFNLDVLSICGIASGTFDDGEDSKFIGGVGISPISVFNGKLKAFIGYDIGNRKAMRGEMTTLSAVVNF